MKTKIMKRQILTTTVTLIFVCIFFQSCKKDDASTTVTPPVITPTVSTTFTWKENAGTLITADSAFWTSWSTGTGIRAYKGGMQNFFEINWTSANNTSIGAKALTTNNGDFTFLKGSVSYDISSNQNLNITAFTNDKLSGNFTFTVKGGAITSIEATFTDLPKK
jgi:hypothetical protein